MTTENLSLQKIKQTVMNLNKKQKTNLAVIAFFAITTLYMFFCNHGTKNIAIMNDVSDPKQVAAKLGIPESKAKDVVKEIEEVTKKPPTTSWTVAAVNTQEAAKIVERQIENKTAPPLPPADKTIVTPKETKVDVYRIDLDADWEVGIGYGNHNGDSYIPVEVQRNYSKHKAVAAEVHMDMSLQKVKGYEIKHVWRF